MHVRTSGRHQDAKDAHPELLVYFLADTGSVFVIETGGLGCSPYGLKDWL